MWCESKDESSVRSAGGGSDERICKGSCADLSDKKIASVKHKSVMKRFNEMRFAAGANRDYMESIEFAKLSLDDLIDIALEEMGKISDILGL